MGRKFARLKDIRLTAGCGHIRLLDIGLKYCEVYAPSFLGNNRDQLAEEIRKFAEHCQQNDLPNNRVQP